MTVRIGTTTWLTTRAVGLPLRRSRPTVASVWARTAILLAAVATVTCSVLPMGPQVQGVEDPRSPATDAASRKARGAPAQARDPALSTLDPVSTASLFHLRPTPGAVPF